MIDDERATQISKIARELLLQGTKEKLARMDRFTFGPAWPLAKKFAGERAIELMTRAQAIADELTRVDSAVSVLTSATKLVGTYSPETMRELYLAAVADTPSGSKPGERREDAVGDLALAWRDCTGRKATASFNRTDGCERQTPFVQFATQVFDAADVEMSPRNIRLALDKKSHRSKGKVVRAPT